MKTKAIFLDMDGTVLDSQNKVSLTIKKVIDRLRSQGLYVFIATGRSAMEVKSLVPKGFEVDGIVASNGMEGHINDEILFEHSLPLDLVETIIAEARKKEVYYELFPYNAPRIMMAEDQAFIERAVEDPKPEEVEINEWLSRKQAVRQDIVWTETLPEQAGYSKFYFFSRTTGHIDEWKAELERLKEHTSFTTSTSSSHNVEVMSAGINKASGIKEMVERYNLSQEDTLAVGDSHNDLPMFEYVHHAVAMQNAADDIKAIADEVTEFTCDEDGVAAYLEHTFLKNKADHKA
ncbi:Cof-type HAD-IIB family hydrolase [Sinobaca sp. H24]|uniref:Cof-type HAD-IIB family hydrolase n=1 Tax=Sinobaca sp. H24 TaxID=2923376 RepID=UPI002079CFA2|nr:Cof-type HAD-IIB family hydrolase [Sinobaca sp. H24]